METILTEEFLYFGEFIDTGTFFLQSGQGTSADPSPDYRNTPGTCSLFMSNVHRTQIGTLLLGTLETQNSFSH